MPSRWDCRLEGTAVRLGLRLVKGLKEESAQAIQDALEEEPFASAEDLARRTGLDQQQMTVLASGDALMSLSGHRRLQVWDAAAQRGAPALLRDALVDEDYLELPAAPEGEAMVFDYASLGLSLRAHPLALLWDQLKACKLMTAADLAGMPDRRIVMTCGIVTTRQQHETAKGTIFVLLEEETGDVQVIVHKTVWERQRAVILKSRLLAVKGSWQRADGVTNLIAGYMEDLTPMLGGLRTKRREFR